MPCDASQSRALPAVQPLLHPVDPPALAHTLHEKASVKAGIFLPGVDVELVPGDLLRVQKLLSLVGALGLSYSAQGTYKGEQFLDAEQITKNKLYIYTREKNTGFDRRFLMKRVNESWMIDAVQERLDGWQRTGL